MAEGAVKIVIHEDVINEVLAASAMGLFRIASAIVADAHVPDEPPLGQGLVQGGGALVYVGEELIATMSSGPEMPVKPPDVLLVPGRITVVGGFGFPARFQEEGTAHEPARPFFTPSLMAHLPDVPDSVAVEVKKVTGQ